MDIPKYVISVVSQMLNIHPQTLRLYEKMKLITPARVDGKNRLYSENDIEKLKYIMFLTRNMKVNLAGVEIILNMQEQILDLNKKINELEQNIKLKYGEDISIKNNLANNNIEHTKIKIERE